MQVVPELSKLANLDLKVLFNKDSSAVGPHEWIQMAKALHASRDSYDAFLVRLEIAVKTGNREEEGWTCIRRDRLRVSHAKLGKKHCESARRLHPDGADSWLKSALYASAACKRRSGYFWKA